jgi:hypothetical protein
LQGVLVLSLECQGTRTEMTPMSLGRTTKCADKQATGMHSKGCWVWFPMETSGWNELNCFLNRSSQLSCYCPYVITSSSMLGSLVVRGVKWTHCPPNQPFPDYLFLSCWVLSLPPAPVFLVLCLLRSSLMVSFRSWSVCSSNGSKGTSCPSLPPLLGLHPSSSAASHPAVFSGVCLCYQTMPSTSHSAP